MNARDALLAESSSAVAIVGLLLVFLPMFLSTIASATGGRVPFKKLRLLEIGPWLVVAAVVMGSADATAGLLTLWGTFALAKLTAILLLVLMWFVCGLAGLAVIYGG